MLYVTFRVFNLHTPAVDFDSDGYSSVQVRIAYGSNWNEMKVSVFGPFSALVMVG